MKTLKLFITIITVSVAFPVYLQAQVENYSTLKLHIEGFRAKKQFDFDHAIRIYSTLYDKKPMNSRIGFKLAELYEITRQYEKARELYKQLYEMDPDKNTLALYSFGQMAMASGDYRLAHRGFEKFNNDFDGGDKKKYLEKLTDVYLESIKQLLDTNRNANIPLMIDSVRLMFSNHYSEAGYSMFGVKNRNISESNLFIPTSVFDEEPPEGYLSPDKKHFYFSQCSFNKKKYGCAVYRAILDSISNSWSNTRKLPSPVNDKKYMTMHPTVGTDARRGNMILYFVSDRPDGRGGLDIWYSRYDPRKSRFREPKNAGSKINTPEDECSPYYDDRTRTLYFSSRGMQGHGAFDIFRAKGEQRNWTEPVNLGKPINSSTDDYFYHYSQKEHSFLFASNRNTWEKMDISTDQFFAYTPLDMKKLRVQTDLSVRKDKIHVKGIFQHFDSVMMKEINRAHAEVFITEKSQEPVLIKSDSVHTDRQFTLFVERDKTFKINVVRYSDTSSIEFQSLTDLNDTLQHIHFELPSKKHITLVKTVHYDLNQAKLSEKDKTVIDSSVVQLLENKDSCQVFIHSYTDKTGSSSHNKKLSVRRARNVYNYLASKNIDKSNMQFEGFGATNPLVPEHFPDGSDNPEARKANRRTEIILKFID